MRHSFWIRGPVWDGLWIFSGVPIGLALMLGQFPALVVIAAFLTINSAHLISPAVMGWSHHGFRPVMLAHKTKYIIVPLCILLGGATAGATVGKIFFINPVTLGLRVKDWHDYMRPMIALLPIFFVWNIYHFAMQNYGFLRIYKPNLNPSIAMQWAMFCTIMAMVIIPETIGNQYLGMFCLGAVVFSHQLAAVGVAGHIWANNRRRSPWWFVGGVMGFGLVAAWLMLHSPPWLLMTVIGARMAASFVHFLYDRYIYKFSDPQVRATIGADLIAPQLRVIPPFPAFGD